VSGGLVGLAVLLPAMTLSQFFRTALGVVAPELATDLALGAEGLGLLSGAWFYAFAAMQIPVGMALDRFGPRRSVAALMVVAALGCVVFASAEGAAWAIAGQALIGFGCSPIYMGALIVLARWYPPDRFALLSGVFIAISNLGNILGTTPLAFLAETVGWRSAFAGLGGAVLLSAMAIGLLVRDAPPGKAAGQKGESLRAVLRGVGKVMLDRRLWPILAMLFSGYAVLLTLRGLWLGPYFSDLFGLDPVARGNVLLLLAILMGVTPIAYGMLERRLDRRREPVLYGTSVAALCFLALALVPAVSFALSLLLLLVGITGGMAYALLMAQGRQFLDDHQIGRGLTLLNCSVFFGAAVIQSLSGGVVGLGQTLGGNVGAYGLLFAFLALCLGLSLLAYRRSEDRRLGQG
jgi:MFS family permease